MFKFLISAVAFIFLSATAQFSDAQTILSDTTINDQFVFNGKYDLYGNVTFGSEAELHFSKGTEISLSDSTYFTVLGSISYASDYDSVSVRSQVTDLSSVEVHFFGHDEDSIKLHDWRISDLLLRPQVVYSDSLAVINFHNYRFVDLQRFNINNCGVVQVNDNALSKTFGAVMLDSIAMLSIENSVFSKCHSSNNGGAITICNSDSIYITSSRFYENVGIDSAMTAGRILYWGQGSSCSIDISNRYLEVNKCIFAFNKETVTTTYFSANRSIINGSLFYDNSRVSLLTQASVSNTTTITSSSFLHSDNAISGGANLQMKDCVISNDTIPILNRLGRSVEFFVNIPPRFESSNVYYPRGAECVRCGNGFLPYNESDEVLDENSSFELDGYVFEGVFPKVNGLLLDVSMAACFTGETDVFGGTRCIGSAPDIGAVERQQTVAVEEVDVATDFTLYPNPTSAHLYVSTTQAWEVKVATLTDLSGRQWPLQIDRIDEYTNLLLLPTGLRAGAYVVKVFDATRSPRTGKVIISQSW
ncbi:MAG: T9SS type A sorting domain-containing protein [Saprospiraceae bacterium]